MNDERLALEEFLINNPELERLEALLDEFNIFETLGAVNVELRHSEFLAFLMNPNQSHGLGDVFVKRFLQKAVAGVDPIDLPFTAIDLDIWNLDDLEVKREWYKIDILLLNDEYRLAVIIENKVGSGEHSGQLQRYYQIIERQYPNWKILALFLTPKGDEPTDDRYLPVSYETVCTLIESISTSRESSLGPDIHTLMTHYTAMLRRHILSGSEIQELCQKIYRKHQRALDLLFEYRPDRQTDLFDFLIDLIKSTPGVTLDVSTKGYIRFVADELDTPILRQGQGWTETGRILMFQINNFENRMRAYFLIGPGPGEIRQKLFDIAVANQPPFKSSRKAMGKKHHTIYLLEFLAETDYEKLEMEELQIKIQSRWQKFISVELPKLTEHYKEKPWLWQALEIEG